MDNRPKILQHLSVFDEGADAFLSRIALKDCPYCAFKQKDFYDAWTTGWHWEKDRFNGLRFNNEK